ncbi:protein ROOT HAIR DEFECTIVE 3-like [Triticum dicoccoides]|uniref:protein ROOT HAIR DEFECTIVE 3-like n=1 Tax=Triticum dicoccoides TaxID=85692 RepID=UPI000E7952FF|nr:protein ROOT HAIR DEFECTIVE 3-like [Triticum dicoccoides]
MSIVRNRKEYIQAIADECMMMLWIISEIRLDGDGDTFENFRSLLDEGPRATDRSYHFDPLASISHKKVLILKAGTLISSDKCKLLWSQFMVHVDSIVTLVLDVEGKLTRTLGEPVKEFLRSARDNTWATIKMLLVTETIAAASYLQYGLLDLVLDEGAVKELLSRLKNHGRNVVESKAKEEAATISMRMKDRFTKLFNTYLSREQKRKIDVQAIVQSALDECMLMLWVISAIRLDGDGDTIENFRYLLDDGPLAYISREEELILRAGTLISPDKCKLIWYLFMVEVDPIVKPALDAQEAYKWNKRMSGIQIALLALRVATSTLIFVTTGVPVFF